jgi:diguanylate cyclase (GGDEF)-like protein
MFAQKTDVKKMEDMIFSDGEDAGDNYMEEVFAVNLDRWFDVHKSQIDWVDGRKVSLCTIYDITDKKTYQQKAQNQQSSDFLTGLLNRSRCEQDLGQAIKEAQRDGGTGAILYLDLDDFKNINDGLGHQYGDVLLKGISQSLRQIAGIEHSCYRMGGDEFMVIIPHTMYGQMNRILDEITSIFTRSWRLKGGDYYCTMSMGIACFPADGSTVEELIRKADMALSAAKNNGKNCIEYCDDQSGRASCRRLDLEKNMWKAAMHSCDEFEVYYQPIVNVSADGMPCCGAEALVRWNSNALGFIQPDDFIPLAEYLGLIIPIGEFVLQKAAKRCKHWNDMGHPDYKVNVNLSVVQLMQDNIVDEIKKVLEETQINPANLTLEVTESLAINDMERMKTVLNDIRALGVKLALDDFGTGYSSLNHIREIPLDVIKVDRCFIEHIGEDEFSDAFLNMVTELAHTLGVRVCVEGVENSSQCENVRKKDVQMIQGFYFGKPMKIDEFEERYVV